MRLLYLVKVLSYNVFHCDCVDNIELYDYLVFAFDVRLNILTNKCGKDGTFIENYDLVFAWHYVSFKM